MLTEVAKTALTGKSTGAVKEFLSDISVKAVLSVAQEDDQGAIVDLDDIKVQKKQGAPSGTAHSLTASFSTRRGSTAACPRAYQTPRLP